MASAASNVSIGTGRVGGEGKVPPEARATHSSMVIIDFISDTTPKGYVVAVQVGGGSSRAVQWCDAPGISGCEWSCLKDICLKDTMYFLVVGVVDRSINHELIQDLK
jgi:hypothetical protein